MELPQNRRDAFKWLWAVANLSATKEEKALLWPLALHADGNGTSFPGETLLCRESGIGSERTLRRVLRRLERAGWIKTARNSRPVKIEGRTFYANFYRLTIPSRRADITVSGHDHKTGGQNEQDGRTNQHPREDKTHETGGHSLGREMSIELPRMSTELNAPEQTRVGNLGFSIGKIIGGGGGDKYEEIMGLVGEDAIANFTAEFCADTDRPRAIGGYKKAIRLIGTEEFKSKLCRFRGAVDAREDPPNRGGTFFKHYLKPAMEAKAKR